jgi:hypothetical protein
MEHYIASDLNFNLKNGDNFLHDCMASYLGILQYSHSPFSERGTPKSGRVGMNNAWEGKRE